MLKLIISNYDDVKNPSYGGGGAVAVREIAQRLAQEFDVTVLTGKYPGSKNRMDGRVKYERVGISIFGPKAGQLVFFLLLPFYCRSKKFDLWIESFTPPFSTAFLPLFAKKPVIGLAHTLAAKDAQAKYYLPFFLIETLGLKVYRHVIAVSESERTEILKANPQAQISVIPNGVHMPGLQQKGPGKYVLFVGRIEIRQKGLDLLLQAYLLVKNKINLPLYIAGAGARREENKLKNLIKELNLTKTVTVLGKVEKGQKHRLYKDAAITAVPSRFETFSLTALESLAFGVPVAAFDVKGLDWLPAAAAIKVRPFEPEALAAGLLELEQNPLLRMQMGQRGQVIARQYSWAKAARRYASVINSVLKLQGSSADKFDKNMFADIVTQKLPCYFISPHLDDAVLSAGNLISYLAKKTEVTIVTVFTQAGDDVSNTSSAKRFLRQCGFLSAKKLYKQRRQEDKKVCENLQAKAVHLGFTDALWRQKNNPGKLPLFLGKRFPELLHLYPTYRWHAVKGRLHPQDRQLSGDIAKAVSKVAPASQQAAIFCPAGFGNHVDHLLVRSLCQQLFPKAVFWQDLPYGLSGLPEYFSLKDRIETVWPGNVKEKQTTLSNYRTQFLALYPSGSLPQGNEIFYLAKDGI